MTVHPNSIRSLIPFKKGHQPTRRTAGALVVENYNNLANGSHSSVELLRIGRDERETVARRLAAKSLYRALKSTHAKNGRPLASDDLDRILDRTEGKPTQRVALETREIKDPAALRVELLAVLAGHPELLQSLGDSAARLLAEGVGPPIADEAAEE